MINKGGRPPNEVPNKNRNIRLTDQEWQTFREKLGLKWLREQIAQATVTTTKAVKQTKAKP